jgi:hypothetical protein
MRTRPRIPIAGSRRRPACGQEFWQVISQWMANLRLELGHRLHPSPVRMTEVAQASPLAQDASSGADDADACESSPCTHNSTAGQPSDPGDRAQATCSEQPAAPIYGPPQFAQTPRAGKFAGTDFPEQPDGTLRCPANHPLYAETRRAEDNGTVRVLYAARLPDCRGCPLREQCLLHGEQTKGPRRVSAVLRPLARPSPPPEPTRPLPAPTQPILWGDWSRCQTRGDLVHLLRTQTVTIAATAEPSASQEASVCLTRPKRAHWRLSWAHRLSRNASKPCQPCIQMHLFGIPRAFAASVGLAAA